MRGRKPIPTQLKKLAGNPGKRKLREPMAVPAALPASNVHAESSAAAGEKKSIPQCPAHLAPAARYEWKRIASVLAALGILTEIDRSALAAYCVLYARWADAERKVQELGVLVPPPESDPPAPTLFDSQEGGQAAPLKTPHPSQLVWNPWLHVANKAMAQMLKFLTEFGMTPSSRERIHAGAETSDDTENFLFGDEADSSRQPSNHGVM